MSVHLAASMIGYTDQRAFKHWCENYGVRIFQDLGSRARYVFTKEFEDAANYEIKKYTQKKYGNSPEEITSTLKLMSEVLIAQKEPREKYNRNKYSPTSKHEKIFMSRLTNVLNKNNNKR
ncbi:MAG: hypothetical protein EYC69_10040 [Bacteroidetes bacterium]|nr:MAG: hypothetical protein EYC69_10040 [Bacteroidota bacterium]